MKLWLASIALVLCLACQQTEIVRERYRLADSGDSWTRSTYDPVLRDLQARYPEFFDAIYSTGAVEPDLRPLRDDLEQKPVNAKNFDALNAVAVGYFELNARAETHRGETGYLQSSFRVAKVLAVPWRAYGEIDEPRLRDAILDFFEDASSGKKSHSSRTAPRLLEVIESLGKKESSPERSARIQTLRDDLATRLARETRAVPAPVGDAP